MDTSSFSDIQQTYPDAELLSVGGGTCDCYRVRLYGKLHFLKRLKPEFRTDPRYVLALQKEFETGYRLDHPHLVRYVSKGDDYLLTEYVDSETLAQFAASHPEYFKSRKHADRFISQLLDVVGYLHQHQIVHLDLKPENILITRIGHEVKLTDLGFCYTDTYTDTMGRTDKYAAPEQLPSFGKEGLGVVAKPDARTDIYAIGKILQTLPNSIIYNKVVARCTAANPSDRYQSVEEVQRALKSTIKLPRMIFLAVAIGLGITLLLYLQRPTAENRQERTLGLDTAQTQRPAPVIHPTDTPIHKIKAASPQKTNTFSPSEQPSVIADPKPSREVPLRELSVQEEVEIRRITLSILRPIYQRKVESFVNRITRGDFDDRFPNITPIRDSLNILCNEANQEVYAGLRKKDLRRMYPYVHEDDVNTTFLHAIGDAGHFYSQTVLHHFYPKTKLPPNPFGELNIP